MMNEKWKIVRCSSPIRRRVTVAACQVRSLNGQREIGSLCDVRSTETNRLVLLVRPTPGVVGRPAGQVLKQTDCTNLSIRAKVEPMPGSSRHANQITRFDFDRHY